MSDQNRVLMRRGERRGLAVAAFCLCAAIAAGLWPSSVGAVTPGRYLDPIFKRVVVTSNLVYGKATLANGTVEALKLDLYRPYGDRLAKRPVVIWIHGGDWRSDKALERNAVMARSFAQRGFVAASINYRSGVSGIQQEAQWDIRAAVRWFRSKAALYNLNKEQIMLVGSSAGAIGALTVNFNPEDAGNSGNPGYSSRVASTVSIGGTATDFAAIRAGESPIGMIHAIDDRTIPYATAAATCEFTKAQGNVCEMFTWTTGGHPPDFITNNLNAVIEQASAFMCRAVIGRVKCHDANGDGVVDG